MYGYSNTSLMLNLKKNNFLTIYKMKKNIKTKKYGFYVLV